MNKSYQNFKKRVGKLAVTFALVGTTAAGGMAVATDSVDAATVKSGYTSTTVTLRKSASTKSAKLTTIKKGAKVTILKTSGKWLKVKYNGKTGYVYKTYVKKTFTTKDYSGKFKLKTDLNVRKGPGTSFVKAGTLKKGTVVTVKGKTSNGWYTITYKGSTRYISASSKYLTKYVAPTPKPDPKPDPTPEKNNAPTISVNDTYTLVKGDDFDYAMLKATAEDKEDGKIVLTDANYSGIVNTGKVDEYKVIITVKDSKGATATKTVKVCVVDNEAPEISVENDEFTVVQNRKFDEKEEIKAIATDKENGNLTDKIQFSGKIDTTKLGTQEIKLTVKDSHGKEAVKIVKVNVVANSKPKIETGKDKYYVIKDTSFDPMKDVIATDQEDGDITSKITVTKNNVNVKETGNYKVEYTVKDSDGAVTVKTIDVEVTRNTPPAISFENKAVQKISHDVYKYEIIKDRKEGDFTYSELRAVASDLQDGNITVTDANFSGEKVDVGTKRTYKLILTVNDSNGGTTKVTIYVHVVDNKAPVVNVKNSKIRILQNTEFNKNILIQKAGISVVDEDGNLPVTCYDIDKVDVTKAGINYRIGVMAEDKYGAKDYEYVDVEIVKNEAPVIGFKNNKVQHVNTNRYQLKWTNGDTFDTSFLGAYAVDPAQPEFGVIESDISHTLKYTYEKIDTNTEDNYEIKITATDKHGIVGTVYVEISVDNNHRPVVDVSKNTISFTTRKDPLTKDELKAQLIKQAGLTFSDADQKDSTLTLVYDGFDGTCIQKAGEYPITIKAVDNKGVSSDPVTVTILVQDKELN